MPLIDLSHTISDGMVTYPGIPAPQITSHLTFEDSVNHYAPGTEFQIGLMTLAANTGTYLDTPAHRFREGHDLSGLALERCADLRTIVIRCRSRSDRAIDPTALADIDLEGGAVLFDTGWDTHWGTPRYAHGDHPYLMTSTATELIERGAALVGIDSLNVDSTDDGTRPIHSLLLGADIPIVEHLCKLVELPDTGARFFATPPTISGMATFPVRAFAIVARADENMS